MPILTVRANGDAYVLNATRTPAGTPLSNSQDNATPLLTEYVSFSNGAPDGRGEYIANMAGETLTFTSTQRIRAVRARVDMQNVSDPGKSVYGTLLIRDPAYGDTPKDWLSSTLAGTIVQRTGRWNTVHPSGGIWGSGGVGRAQVRFAPYRPASGTFARIHGLYLDVHVKDQPTIGPLTVSATNTTRPTIAGDYVAAEGDALARLRLKVFTAAQVAKPGFDPESQAAHYVGTAGAPFYDSGDRATSVPAWTVGRDLNPAVSYVAFLKAAFLVNGVPFWSSWVTTGISLATEAATTPLLTVSTDTTLRRVLLGFQGRVNLLPTADDGDFEASVGNFIAGAGAAPDRSTVVARHGVGAMRYLGNGTAAPWFANTGNSGAGGVSVKAGQTFRLSGFVRAGTTGRTWHIVARLHDTENTYSTQSPAGSNVTDTSGAWSALPEVTYTVPTDGILYFQIESTGTPPSAEAHYFDQLQIVAGTAAVTWSPAGLMPTSTASVEAWDRSEGLDNRARPEVAASQAGYFTRSTFPNDTLVPDISTSAVGGYSQRWVPSSTTSEINIGIETGAFEEDYALPGFGGLRGIGSLWLRASVAGNYTLDIDALDAVGGTVTAGLGAVTAAVTTAWTRFSVSAVLPVGTAHCRVGITNASGATGQSMWACGFQWELRDAAASTALKDWVPGQGRAPDWQPVRGGTQVMDSSEAFTVADYEPPPGIVRVYRARVNTILPGLTNNLATPDVTTSTGVAWLAPTGTWVMKDVYAPDRNAAVRVTGMAEGFEPDAAVFHPAGADRAVGFVDYVGGEGNGQIVVTTLGDTEWAKLRGLLSRGNVILLDLPEGGHRYLLVQRASWPRAGPLGQIQRQVSVDVAEVSPPPDVDDLAGFILAGTAAIAPPPVGPTAALTATSSTQSRTTASLAVTGAAALTATSTVSPSSTATLSLPGVTGLAAISVTRSSSAAIFSAPGTPFWRSTGGAASDASVFSLQSVMAPTWQTGDRLIMDIAHSGADTATITTDLTALGWTLEANAKAGFGQLWRYSKVAGSSESAPLVTFSNSSALAINITAVGQAGVLGTSLTAADTTAANTTPITAPSLTVEGNSLVLVGYCARAAGAAVAANPDPDYIERAETKSTSGGSSNVTMELATRGPTAAATLSGDTWAPATAARDLLIITEVKAPVATTNDYGFPSYSTLMARVNRIDVAATQGAETYAQVTYGTGIGADCTINLEGWKGRPNGGKGGLKWAASWPYAGGDMVVPTTSNGRVYKCTAAGTSASTEGTWPAAGVGNTKTSGTAVFTDVGATTASNPTALVVGGSWTSPVTGVLKPAILGSTPATPAANVGRIQGLGVNNTQDLFPLDCYQWGWTDRKGLANGSDPNGTWTGPNLDEHALRLQLQDPNDGTWGVVIDGVVFDQVNDAMGLAAQAGARTIFRNCLFMNVGDDCCEADFNNNSSEYYDCLFLNVYTIYSTTGGANRSTEQSLMKNCIAVFGHTPWRKAIVSITCPDEGLRNNTATDGWYWGHGALYKQATSNANKYPRFRMEDCQLFIPGYSTACKNNTGLSGSGFASASNTTLRFGRGKATTAGNGAAVPQSTIPLEDWDTATAFMPTGVTIINDSTSGYEAAVQAAIDAWINGTGGHNPHPQMASFV